MLILRLPKGGCCSISDDLSCFFRNYFRTFSDQKTAPTRRRVNVKVMMSQYDHKFRFAHIGVVGNKPLETRIWILIKHMDIRVLGRRIIESNTTLMEGRGNPLRVSKIYNQRRGLPSRGCCKSWTRGWDGTSKIVMEGCS